MGKHIMLWRFSSMGDLAILEPVLRHFLHQYPEHRLTLVSRPKFAPIFAQLDRLDYYAIDLDHDFKGIGGLWKLAGELHRLKADHILDLHHVLRTIILRRFFRLRWGQAIPHLDKDRKGKKALAAKNPNKSRDPLMPSYQRYADLFGQIGLPVELRSNLVRFPELPLTVELRDLLKGEGKRLALAPFGRYSGKSYPADLVESLISALLEEYENLEIYLFGGGPDQESHFRKWERQWPKKVHNLAGRFSLEDELALMKQLDLMVAVDSANMHFAAMLELPVISLWGATHPAFGFYPWQQPLENALIADLEQYSTLPSSMNGKKLHPGTEDCMRSIPIVQIVEKVKALMP
jgi:ADP-heptose:LPS heptosyltransferase